MHRENKFCIGVFQHKINPECLIRSQPRIHRDKRKIDRKGCFEVYSSATGLVRMTKEALAANPESAMKDEERISARTAFNYMRAGDATAKQVVDDYIKYLAAGITNTINIFQPDILCIGGGVCNEGDPLLVPMKEIVKKEVYTRNSAKNTEIVIAKLGNDAGIIGAAFLGNAHD